MKQATLLLKALGLLFIAEYSAAQLTNPKGALLMCMRRCTGKVGWRKFLCWKKCRTQPVEPEECRDHHDCAGPAYCFNGKCERESNCIDCAMAVDANMVSQTCCKYNNGTEACRFPYHCPTLKESIAKEGEQCRWTSSYCKQKEEGKKTCMSSKEMKYCEEGFKCTVDPNDTSTGFCRKHEGTQCPIDGDSSSPWDACNSVGCVNGCFGGTTTIAACIGPDKYKKLGEQCSINGKNCVGELVCEKMEDGCNNGVGRCQPNEGIPEKDCGCLCKCCKQAGVPEKCLYEHTKIANEIRINGTHKALTTIESKECSKHMNQLRSCEAECLKPPCQTSEWMPWSTCDAGCGPGIATRHRTILNLEVISLRLCPDLWETKQCQATRDCCEWKEWSTWSECSQTCGGGQRVRRRSLKYNPKDQPGYGPGQGHLPLFSCDDSLSSRIQFDACNKNYCPVDCKIKRIESPCSKTCVDHGSRPTKSITSRIVQQPSFGGRPCPRVGRIERECFAPPCPPPDCRDKTDCISCCCCRHHIPPKCLEEELSLDMVPERVNQTHHTFNMVKSIECHKFTTDLNKCKLDCHNDGQHDNKNYQCQTGGSGRSFGGWRSGECVPAKSLEICEKCQNSMQCKAPFKCCPITKLCVLDCNTDCKGAEKAICHPPCKDDMDPKSCQCLSSNFPLNWGGATCLKRRVYYP